jgi:hypothetical protein
MLAKINQFSKHQTGTKLPIHADMLAKHVSNTYPPQPEFPACLLKGALANPKTATSIVAVELASAHRNTVSCDLLPRCLSSC